MGVWLRRLVFLCGFCIAGGVAQGKPNSVGIDMVKIPAGSFMMGSGACKTVTGACPKDDPFTTKNEAEGCTPSETVCTGSKDERPRHKVTLTRVFYLSKTEVTQKQYHAVMGTNSSKFTGDDQHPVESVSWFDAIKFANALSQKEGLPACYDDKGNVIGGSAVYACKGYRLPTEAEWEYAARAGTEGARYGKLDDIAWYGKNSGNKTHPVGKKKPNTFGLFDMLGNVYEWCHDWYGDYPTGSQTNPDGPRAGSGRVFRGGSWFDDAGRVRAADRYFVDPSRAYGSRGFRLARSAP